MILKKDKIENKEENVLIENILYDSSNVIKTSYNYNTKQIYVTFHRGGVYYYNDVQEDLYNELKESDSIGKFINSKLKQTHSVFKKGDMTSDNLTLLKEEISKLKNDLL